MNVIHLNSIEYRIYVRWTDFFLRKVYQRIISSFCVRHLHRLRVICCSTCSWKCSAICFLSFDTWKLHRRYADTKFFHDHFPPLLHAFWTWTFISEMKGKIIKFSPVTFIIHDIYIFRYQISHPYYRDELDSVLIL